MTRKRSMGGFRMDWAYPEAWVKELTDIQKPSKGAEQSQPRPPDGASHNIAVYVKEARGGPRKSQEQLEGFLAIVKKLPVHRTLREHNTVWKMLKTIPDLTSQLTDEHLKILSKNVISETWVKGSTVIGNDGLYVILKGRAWPQRQVPNRLMEGNESTASLLQSFPSCLFSDDLETTALAERSAPPLWGPVLRPWSTFGTLEVTAQVQLDPKEYSVLVEDDLEILKIPAKKYEKLKLEETQLKNKQIVSLIHKCPYYQEWPTMYIYDLALLVQWKTFPPGHVIVESGDIISFVAYINSGYCDIYRNIVGLVRLQSKRVKKVRKHVCMGRLKEKESFGEISVLLHVPFTCTVITGKEVEMAIIEDKKLFELNPVTQQLMLQTAKPTFGHLTDEDVKNEYMQKEQQKEWDNFKNKTMKNSLYYNGVVPGFGKWGHHWTSLPKKLKDTLVSY